VSPPRLAPTKPLPNEVEILGVHGRDKSLGLGPIRCRGSGSAPSWTFKTEMPAGAQAGWANQRRSGEGGRTYPPRAD
jgi:hypothetical protein